MLAALEAILTSVFDFCSGFIQAIQLLSTIFVAIYFFSYFGPQLFHWSTLNYCPIHVPKSEPAIPERSKNAISKLITRSAGETCVWLNKLISDILFATASGRLVQLIHAATVSSLEEKLAEIQSETWLPIGSLRVVDFLIGKDLPKIHIIKLSSSSDTNLAFVLDVEYEGGLSIAMNAAMALGLRDLTASLKLQKTVGKVVLKFDRDPNPRLSLMLTTLPQFVFNLDYGASKLLRVSSLIHTVFKSVMRSRVIFPNYQTILFRTTATSTDDLFFVSKASGPQARIRVNIISANIAPLAKQHSLFTGELPSTYCQLSVGEQRSKTFTTSASLTPSWNDVFEFSLADPLQATTPTTNNTTAAAAAATATSSHDHISNDAAATPTLIIRLYRRKKRLAKDELLGTVEMPMDASKRNDLKMYTVPFGENAQSSITFELFYFHQQDDGNSDIDWIYWNSPVPKASILSASQEDRQLDKVNWANVKYALDRLRKPVTTEGSEGVIVDPSEQEASSNVIDDTIATSLGEREEDAGRAIRPTAMLRNVCHDFRGHLGNIIAYWDHKIGGDYGALHHINAAPHLDSRKHAMSIMQEEMIELPAGTAAATPKEVENSTLSNAMAKHETRSLPDIERTNSERQCLQQIRSMLGVLSVELETIDDTLLEESAECATAGSIALPLGAETAAKNQHIDGSIGRFDDLLLPVLKSFVPTILRKVTALKGVMTQPSILDPLESDFWEMSRSFETLQKYCVNRRRSMSEPLIWPTLAASRDGKSPPRHAVHEEHARSDAFLGESSPLAARVASKYKHISSPASLLHNTGLESKQYCGSAAPPFPDSTLREGRMSEIAAPSTDLLASSKSTTQMALANDVETFFCHIGELPVMLVMSQQGLLFKPLPTDAREMDKDKTNGYSQCVTLYAPRDSHNLDYFSQPWMSSGSESANYRKCNVNVQSDERLLLLSEDTCVFFPDRVISIDEDLLRITLTKPARAFDLASTMTQCNGSLKLELANSKQPLLFMADAQTCEHLFILITSIVARDALERMEQDALKSKKSVSFFPWSLVSRIWLIPTLSPDNAQTKYNLAVTVTQGCTPLSSDPNDNSNGYTLSTPSIKTPKRAYHAITAWKSAVPAGAGNAKGEQDMQLWEKDQQQQKQQRRRSLSLDYSSDHRHRPLPTPLVWQEDTFILSNFFGVLDINFAYCELRSYLYRFGLPDAITASVIRSKDTYNTGWDVSHHHRGDQSGISSSSASVFEGTSGPILSRSSSVNTMPAPQSTTLASISFGSGNDSVDGGGDSNEEAESASRGYTRLLSVASIAPSVGSTVSTPAESLYVHFRLKTDEPDHKDFTCSFLRKGIVSGTLLILKTYVCFVGKRNAMKQVKMLLPVSEINGCELTSRLYFKGILLRYSEREEIFLFSFKREQMAACFSELQSVIGGSRPDEK